MLKRFFSGVAVILLIGVTAIPSFGEDSKLRVSNPPSEFVIGDSKNPNPELTFSVFVDGPSRGRVTVQFVDYVYGNNGQKQNLPSDSTPYSLAKVLTVEPFESLYLPRNAGKELLIKLRPKLKKIDTMYFGGIKISLEPESASGKKSTSASPSAGILSQVNVTPFGWAGEENKAKILASKITNLYFTSVNRTSIIDYIIPDLPGLVNSGPIEAKVRYENKGQLPNFTSVKWLFASNGRTLASKSVDKSLILAGKDATRSVITQASISGTSGMASVLPSSGPVEVTTILQSEIGGTKFKPQVNKSTVLIVQWKEPFFFIALAVAFAWYVLRKRPAKDSKKRKEPSLAWLAVIALKKYVVKRYKNR